jgi:hypothetical protein
VPLNNFRFFALGYLDDWICDDGRFFYGLSSESTQSDRLATLHEAANYYKVNRTLPTLKGEERLSAALVALDAVPAPVTEETIDQAVCGLATRLRQIYGRYAISAASKFLWLRYRWPVVILDDRAAQCLWASGATFGQGDYPAYRREWRKHFAASENAIDDACSELVNIKAFSLASDMPDDLLLQLTSERWFRERVFDKFLWWNSDS